MTKKVYPSCAVLPFVIGTRASLLARRQTDHVVASLRAAWPDLQIEVRVLSTAGDRDQTHELVEIGGKGLFTADVESGLHTGVIQLAVHSLKDLPIAEEDDLGELCIAAVMPREDARDVLISRHGLTLAELPASPRIGTCSPRRAVQILARRPDAKIVPLRGNVDTRLDKAATDAYDAIVLAGAGLKRLSLLEHVTEWLPLDLMLPAPGQGALALQCRACDATTLDLLAPLHDADTWAAVTAERSFLSALGAGCAAPVAAYAEPAPLPDGRPGLCLRGLVASPLLRPCDQPPDAEPASSGQRIVRVKVFGSQDEPKMLGLVAAQDALTAGAHAWVGRRQSQ